MTNYAQLDSNIVVNTIVADNKEDAELALNCTLIEITPDNLAGIGHLYDFETGKFSEAITVVRETLASEEEVSE